MHNNSTYRDFERFITEVNNFSSVFQEGDNRNGWQVILTFPNGYGASVINHKYSYDLELAVLKDGSICYGTNITEDVLGHLTPKELTDTLYRIKAL